MPEAEDGATADDDDDDEEEEETVDSEAALGNVGAGVLEEDANVYPEGDISKKTSTSNEAPYHTCRRFKVCRLAGARSIGAPNVAEGVCKSWAAANRAATISPADTASTHPAANCTR